MAGCREKSSTLKRQLDEYEEEHTRMVNLERDREGEFNLALAKLEGLRAEGEPKRQYAPRLFVLFFFQPVQAPAALAELSV